MKYSIILLFAFIANLLNGQGLKYSEFPPIINSAKGSLDSGAIFLVTQAKPGGGLKTYRTTIGDVVKVADTLLDIGWKVTGNSGTDPNVNFIGTTDAQPLKFKVDDVKYGELQRDSKLVFFGEDAGYGNTGIFVVASGFAAAYLNTGSDVVANGTSAVFENTGSDVVGIGSNAAARNTGSDVVALGTNSGNNNRFSKVISLGTFATPTDSFQFIFSDTIQTFVSRNAKYGIGTVTPTAKLHVVGTTRLEGTPQSTTSDSLLTIDGQGNVAWRTPYYYGTDTLTNGVDTVWTSNVTANSNIQLTSNGLNGSTQSGYLDVTAISAGNYFVVNSLKANTTIETGDQRKYYWFFIRKP